MEGAAVLGEVTILLVGGGVLTDRDAMVCQLLGDLLNVRLDRHHRGGRGDRSRAESEEENKEAWIGVPFEVGVEV